MFNIFLLVACIAVYIISTAKMKSVATYVGILQVATYATRFLAFYVDYLVDP